MNDIECFGKEFAWLMQRYQEYHPTHKLLDEIFKSMSLSFLLAVDHADREESRMALIQRLDFVFSATQEHLDKLTPEAKFQLLVFLAERNYREDPS